MTCLLYTSYIDSTTLETYLAAQSGTILGLMNAMSGSAFSMATVFALSIQPYINAVSYTHLDVYKRQAPRRSRPPSPAPRRSLLWPRR